MVPSVPNERRSTAVGSPPSTGIHVPSDLRASISEIEARRSDGTWMPVDGGLPTAVDLLSLGTDGTITLPADLLPEGPYRALPVRIPRIGLPPVGGTPRTITP